MSPCDLLTKKLTKIIFLSLSNHDAIVTVSVLYERGPVPRALLQKERARQLDAVSQEYAPYIVLKRAVKRQREEVSPALSLFDLFEDNSMIDLQNSFSTETFVSSPMSSQKGNY